MAIIFYTHIVYLTCGTYEETLRVSDLNLLNCSFYYVKSMDLIWSKYVYQYKYIYGKTASCQHYVYFPLRVWVLKMVVLHDYFFFRASKLNVRYIVSHIFYKGVCVWDTHMCIYIGYIYHVYMKKQFTLS